MRRTVGAVDDGQLHQLLALELVGAVRLNVSRTVACLSESTYGRDKQLLDLLDGVLHLDLRSVGRVLALNEHVELVLEVLPVGTAAVVVLLQRMSEVSSVDMSAITVLKTVIFN